ncbi:MAG: isoleucine--tRNA ligase [Gammaproteobacteria bacterium]
MSDYKNTLNLPQTKFPMKANLAQREPEMLRHWQDIQLYALMRKQGEQRKKFILHDGPPYANGHIHLGHAVNKVLKDIILKSKALSGYDTPYVPGWDCHGLPIEMNVEKKHGKVGSKINARDFRTKCREYALSQIDIQRQEFKRLGVLGDWDNPYLTMDYTYEANIIRALGKVIGNQHLKQGRKPVYWCMDCASALAEAEVEYKEKSSPAIDVRFTLLEEVALTTCLQNYKPGEGPVAIPIWTTTPWTLPANQAVAVNPQHVYVVVQCELGYGPEQLILAEELVSSVMQKYNCEHYKIIGHGLGENFAGLLLQHPFYDRTVAILAGDHVTLDAGTGAVHTAPGHGMDDFILGQQHDLPIDNPVDGNGVYVDSTPLLAGQHIYKANDTIIELLKTNGKLIHVEKFQHSYPHCWRHKTPIIFRATPQWFIDMDQANLREEALREIANTQWLPQWGQARIAGMIADRPDWCISRQRYWGTPIPLFVHKQTHQLHPHSALLIEQVAELVEQQGVDAWFETDIKTFLNDDADNYVKCTDILDVWFDAGVSHMCVLESRQELDSPADLYLEGSDQHRGWFQSSLLTSVAIHQRAPYRAVLTHGFTVDAQGRKMSKSIGNVIAPEKIINSLGADILRLWVAAADYRAEMSLSDEILQRMTDAYRRIRNTARFLLSNLHDFDPQQHQVKPSDMLALDRWVVARAGRLQQEIMTVYDDYQFHALYQKIHNFCSVDLGSFYLDIIKDRQYTMAQNSVGRRSAQTAMYHILEALVRWLAPILSFTAEEIWRHMPGERESSVFLTTWYEGLFTLNADEQMNENFWQKIIAIRDEVNKLLEAKRSAGVIGSALEAEVQLYCDDELLKLLQLFGAELRFVLITSEAKLASLAAKPSDAEETALKGLALSIITAHAEKCVRCWHRRDDIGQHAEHPELCARCVENVVGEGEQRQFA